ncbi:hypothetical protein K8O96_12080 [Clostridium sporogenes]|uniref:ImmA/IrrE family metallo-endopeptidase n=1 Tax=Clostridium botulinum TaxID=1491 RepID=A0A6M0SV92_CLOBO|nr:hypothetical protein [Clostridium sporogenes]NFA59468.1 hypothetical protein [Clostridium botulinum]NFI74652.1 hypothetical protein [Clostridium sporogenes]NFL71213.1 hypothetical protein [Clostridium sporogenes]NFM25376.1 hypothetical protein [Clostridium sporogenes]NFP62486.1 hypothetical protein [Clostridium sporogenes]
MNIPNKVRIGYKDFKVNLVGHDVIYDNAVCYGNIELDNGIINISNLYSQDQQKCTFIHECLHGIDENVETKLSEEQIRKLSKGLYQFIKDNPDVFTKDTSISNKLNVSVNVDTNKITKSVKEHINENLNCESYF